MDQHLAQLFGDPLRAHDRDLIGHELNGGGGGGIDGEPEPRRQPDRPEHTKFILGEALDRITNGPQHASVEIFSPPHKIDKLAVQGVEKHAIDGKVAQAGILLRRGEGDMFGPTTVDILPIGPKRCDLHLEIIITQTRTEHLDHPKTDADFHGAAKECLNLFGEGVGGDVVVGGGQTE